MRRQIVGPISRGMAGTSALLIFYFSSLTLVSGRNFAAAQFLQNWYWIVGLSVGFGIQIGLFFYLKTKHERKISGKAVTVSGTTSGIAMVACCSHYLVNIIPFIGIAGITAVIGQYQTEFFAIGAISNIIGVGYLTAKLLWSSKS